VIVGLQPLGGDAVAGKELKAALGESGDRCGLLVTEQLGVGQAAVVVDDRVRELPADPSGLLLAGPVPIAGDAMTGPCEARKALDIHLQQIARAGPLKAPHLLPRTFRLARNPAPGQAARDGGVRHPEL
jgi:hypothetical protein